MCQDNILTRNSLGSNFHSPTRFGYLCYIGASFFHDNVLMVTISSLAVPRPGFQVVEKGQSHDLAERISSLN